MSSGNVGDPLTSLEPPDIGGGSGRYAAVEGPLLALHRPSLDEPLLIRTPQLAALMRSQNRNGRKTVTQPLQTSAVLDQRVVIGQLNIEHYRRKLATEADAAKRLTPLRLLAKEEARLAELKHSSGAQPA